MGSVRNYAGEDEQEIEKTVLPKDRTGPVMYYFILYAKEEVDLDTSNKLHHST